MGLYGPVGGHQTLNICTRNCGQYYKEKVQGAMREVQSKQVGVGEPGKSYISEKVSFKERREGSGVVS